MDLFYGRYVVNPASPSPFKLAKPVRFYVILWSLTVSFLLLILGYWSPFEGLSLDFGSLLICLILFMASLKFLLQFAYDFVNLPLLVNEVVDDQGQPIPYEEFRLYSI